MDFSRSKLDEFLVLLSGVDKFDSSLSIEESRYSFLEFLNVMPRINEHFNEVNKELKSNYILRHKPNEQEYHIELFCDYCEQLHSAYWQFERVYLRVKQNAEKTKFKDKNRKLIKVSPFIGYKISTAIVNGTEHYITKIREAINAIEKPEPYIKTPTNRKQVEPHKKFVDLFLKKEDFQRCIEVLRKVRPEIINEKGSYCLGEKSKGSMVAYVKALVQKNKINHTSEATMAKLLNKQFPRLKITDRTLRNPTTKSYNAYYNQFLAVIK